MQALISQLGQTFAKARSLEELTRPLLEMLQKVTSLESTYLTRIDLGQRVQQVLFARNTQSLQIPENLSVPWEDTLCKRAIDENRLYTDDVGTIWGDSQAARALGIQTYASTPVHLSDGALYGTLCGASAKRQPLQRDTQDVMRLFAQFLGQQVEREQLLVQIQVQNEELQRLARTDALTGLPNRRALIEQLGQLQAIARRQERYVLVGMIDMDGFKAINDGYGHEAGDRFLQLLADQRREATRGSDLVARQGGDEFAFAGLGPFLSEPVAPALNETQARLFASTRAEALCLGQGVSLNYQGASVGLVAVTPDTDADSALQQADLAMYQTKQARKARHPVAA